MDPETELKDYVRRELAPFLCRTLDPLLARGVIPAPLVKILRILDKYFEFGLAFVQSEAEVQALIAALDSPNVMRRIGAAKDAALITDLDPAIIAALQRVAVEDKNIHARLAARKALGALAPAELVEATEQDQYLKTRLPFEDAGLVRSDGTVVFDAPMFAGALHVLFALVALGCAFCLVGGIVSGRIIFGGDAIVFGRYSFPAGVFLPIVVGLVFAGAGLWNLFLAYFDFAVPDVILDPPHRELRLQPRFRSATKYSFDEIVEIRVSQFRTRYGEDMLSVSIGMTNLKVYDLARGIDAYKAISLLRWLNETLDKPIEQGGLSDEWADLIRSL